MMIDDDRDFIRAMDPYNYLFNFHLSLLYRSFRQRVVMNKKEKIYSEAGGHTFFVPVEEGFKVRIIEPKSY